MISLFDQKVISLSCTHLTKSCKTLIELLEYGHKYRTRDLHQQHEFRKSIESLVNAIKTAELRTKFCTETFKTIISDARKQNWGHVWRRMETLMKSNKTHGFEQKCRKFVFELEKNPSMILLNEEMQSIAMKIQQDKSKVPFSLPKHKRVCSYCCKSGHLIECTGQCRAYYHRKCSESNHRHPLSTRIDWRAIEDDRDNENDEQTRRTSRLSNTTTICRACKPNAAGRTSAAIMNIDVNNNHEDRSNCDTCSVNFNGNEHTLTCVKCLKSFHSKATCVPAGALLLSQTQLVCCIDVVKRKKSSICSVCHVHDRRLKNCTGCANSFHARCRPNQTKCQHCTTNHKHEGVVFTYRKRKWWPAIIIPNEQVPTRVSRKLYGPGIVSIFIVGENEYEQVQALNLLPSDNFAVIFALNKNDEHGMKNALEIAAAIRRST